ncbi:TetR/AcrR family transcriptional regulator [Saccharothrix sp. Mg75]|uniref:TetR/AcrR family transcriptional regulator n=1 Tax=Saccharothrix sp. Mg75 TaxID=3445357 RepID=UPI003EE91FD2
MRADTEREIRRQARALLVEQGRDAVTLRAIAREVGITAPALYRYYDSREDLLRRLAEDICTDLAAELDRGLAGVDEHDVAAQVFAVCRGFRRWALAHPQEFTLVFASTEDHLARCGPDAGAGVVGDQFGRVFLRVAGRLIVAHPMPEGTDEDVPAELHADLAAFRQVLLTAVNSRAADPGAADSGAAGPGDGGGPAVDETVLTLGAVHHITQCWVRIYGHVALEVFGRFPFAVSNPEPLFDSMLRRMLAETGFAPQP